jgi:hypothetical protein
VDTYSRENSTAETPSEPQNPPPESGSQARNTERILVLHADKARGERRVATLKGDGSDALVLCQAAEAFAFLAQAEEMQIRIDRVELCAAMAAELASHEETTRYPVLLSALKSWSATAANKTVLPTGTDANRNHPCPAATGMRNTVGIIGTGAGTSVCFRRSDTASRAPAG